MNSENLPNIFGKYQIESLLGRGGFGTVYLARDKQLDRLVAVKIMAPELMRDAVWVDRFEQEARMMARLDHPNIVPIYEIGEENGRLYLAMKYINGPSLATQIASKGPLEIEMIEFVMSQIADALDYAYSQGIVHRDLKPSNVLMNGNRAALTDFGFARLVQDNSQSISMSGGVVGTPAYIAPEVWEGKEQGRTSDIYAFGCILYEMLTGEVLFQGESTPAIMLSHFKPPPFAQKHLDNLPDVYWKTLEKALAKQPEKRFTTATAVVEAFSQAKSDPLEAPYTSLLQAMKEEQWQEAEQLANRILSQNSTYRDVDILHAKVQQRQWAAEWKRQAISSYDSNDYETALLSISRWQEIDPDDPEAKTLHEKIKELQSQPSSNPVPPPFVNQGLDTPDPAPDKKAAQDSTHVTRLNQLAIKAIARKDWKTAENIISQIQQLDATNPNIEKLTHQVAQGKEEKTKEETVAFWRNQANEAVTRQQWDSAEKLVERWLDLAPNDPEAFQLLQVINKNKEQQNEVAAPTQQVYKLPPQQNWSNRLLIGMGALVVIGGLILLGVYLTTSNSPPPRTVTEVVEVTRVVEVNTQPTPSPPGINTIANEDLTAEVATFLSEAALAEIETYQTLNMNPVNQYYAGSLRERVEDEVKNLISEGLYHVGYIDFDNSYVQDVRVITEFKLEADSCEYWYGELYDMSGELVNSDSSYRPVPQTLTIETLNTTSGPRWFITDVEFFDPPSFCEGE